MTLRHCVFALWSVTGEILRLPLSRLLFLLASQVNEQRRHSGQRKDREDSKQSHHDQAIGSTLRVVHITVKDGYISERSDLAGRSIDNSEAQVARRIFDAIKITRELALRRQDHNATG